MVPPWAGRESLPCYTRPWCEEVRECSWASPTAKVNGIYHSPNLWLPLVWKVFTASPLSPLGCCMQPPKPSTAACPCYASPGKHPQIAEGWRQHDLWESSQHRLLEKPTQPIYTPTAAAEAEQTEHLQTQENSTASLQEITVINNMYSPFCSPLKKKLKLISLLFT